MFIFFTRNVIYMILVLSSTRRRSGSNELINCSYEYGLLASSSVLGTFAAQGWEGVLFEVQIRWPLCTNRVTSRVTPLRPRMAIAREEGGGAKDRTLGHRSKTREPGPAMNRQGSRLKAFGAGTIRIVV